MLLKDWLKKNNMGFYKFASEVGFHPSFLYAVMKGEKRIGRKLAIKIEKYTSGEVSRSELLWPEDFEEKKSDGNTQLVMNLDKKPKKG